MPEMDDLLIRYQRLVRISQDLASTLDLEILLQRIVNAAADITQAQEASILLYDETEGKLYFQAATNLDSQALRGLSVPVDSSIAGWIVKHEEPLIIGNVKDDNRHFDQINTVIDLSTKSLLGVPLIHKQRVIGALEAINKQDGNFTDADKELLITLGAQAAVAIENTRLFHQSDLISEFVHELRTPLASLNTAAHLLLNPKVDAGQKRQMAEAIQTESLRLSELAASFLDLSRLESGRTSFQMEEIDLPTLMHDCWELMKAEAHSSNLDLQLCIPPSLPKIQGDKDKLKQAFINLLSNAIKYNRPNGAIVFRAERKPEAVSISVKDSGIGIPEEYLPNLFEKFYRVPGSEARAQGTGLGLAIVQRIINNHNGEISVKSTPGQGTEFAILLPA